ncbi:MAG TPA: TlpA family protein disulfide reductase [Gammaproteobacteria bacterium]|nr:TlpA family protein disulfide reductase [Gammaproteobacteria bacterium]
MNKSPAFLLLLFCLTSLPAGADWQQPPLSHNLKPIGQVVKAPDFTLKNMDEEDVRLSDFRGKVILLNFWATWCPPCVREMPSMERLQKAVDTKAFKVLAVNQMEDEDQVFAFTGSLPEDPTFEIVFDKKSEVARAYNVRGLPTTYLLDKKGVVRYRAVGGREFDHPEVIKIINQLIAE